MNLPPDIYSCEYLHSKYFKNREQRIKYQSKYKFPYFTKEVNNVVFVYKILEDENNG